MKPIQLNTPTFCNTVRATVDRLTLEIYRDLLNEFLSDESVLSSDADAEEIMWTIKQFGSAYNEIHIRVEISTLNTILS